MAVGFSTIQSRVQSLLGTPPTSLLSTTEISDRINQLNDSLEELFTWSRRRAWQLLNLVAPKTAGTVAVATTTVTGTTTSFASSDVDSYIRIDDRDFYFLITAVASATSLTIESPGWPDSAVTGKSYKVFRHRYAMPADCEEVLVPQENVGLNRSTQEELDIFDSTRKVLWDNPSHFAPAGRDSSDKYLVEFWPVPNKATSVRVPYMKVATSDLSGTTKSVVPSMVLEYGAASDCSLMLFSKTGLQQWLDLQRTLFNMFQSVLNRAMNVDARRFGLPKRVQPRRGIGGLLTDDFLRSHDVFGARLRGVV